MDLFECSHFDLKIDLKTILRKNNFKVLLIFLFGSILWNSIYGQEEDIFRGELNKIYNEVKSPESESFEKYGSPEVSLYTGTPQINIPLHTVNGREFSLPLSLTYDASGIPVEQMATWVGLSWNLNVGGRITRVTNGLPDGYIDGSYYSIFNDSNTQQNTQNYIDLYASSISNPQFPDSTAAQNYLEFLYDVNLNRIDTQIDYYNLSAPGLNETIVLEKNIGSGFTAKALNNPRVKIEFTSNASPIYISSWTITNEEGTKYVFTDYELTYRQNFSADGVEIMGDANTEYISAWLLTQIISKNGKDYFDITYADEDYEPQRNYASYAGSVVTEILDNVYNYSAPPPGNFTNIKSSVKQRFPNEIFLNSKKMVKFNRGTRKDVDLIDKNKRLASIDFLNWEGSLTKSIEFGNNHYFNSDGLSNANIFTTGKSYFDIRLKLEGLTIKGNDYNDYEHYLFEYIDPDGVPSMASMGQDYFGYYNGAGNNSSLYESIQIDNFNFAGADREPNITYGLKGTLNKITYPTGGYTEFDYESHQVYSSETTNQQDNIMSAGLSTSSPTTLELYSDSQGSYCDDKYLPPFDPRIVIKTFTVLEEDDYILSLTSSNNDLEFYLVDPLNITAPYNNYCDFYNGPIANNVISPLFTPSNQTVHLSAGKYKALLLLGNLSQASSISASVTLSRQVTTINWANRNVGGQRILASTDYTSNGYQATKQTFNYNDGANQSTGSVNYKPILNSIRENETANGNKTQLIRYSTYAKGNEPFVTYSSVTQSNVNGSYEKLGETRHNFYKGFKGSVPMTTPPYENWYFPSLSIGNLSSKSVTRESDGKKLTTEEFDYYETVQRPVSIKSLVVYVDNDNFQKNIFLKQNSSTVSYEYLDTYECPTTPCNYPDYMTNYQNYGYVGIMDPKYSPYRARVANTNGAYGGLNYYKKESIYYDENGNILGTVKSEENTVYDNLELSPKYLPRTKTSIDSKGNNIETKYYYPHDNIVSESAALTLANRVSEIVRTETKTNPGELDEKQIAAFQKDYMVYGSAIMPKQIITFKGGQSGDLRKEFDFYQGGNIKTSNPKVGSKTYYIWGYNSQYSIAEIKNFDANDATNLELLITACQTASNADDGTTTAENSLRTALENLRIALPNKSLMTSYTYDPTIGVTSLTDARGYTTYYEYDEFNRLKNIKDDELKLLNDYQYHYKGQN